jgi:hypothetical protein
MSLSEVKSHFKAPSEGRYVLHSAKTLGVVPFAMRRTTRLTIATLHGGDEEGMYMVYNVGDYLHVAPFDATEKVGHNRALLAYPQHPCYCPLPAGLQGCLGDTAMCCWDSAARYEWI